MEQTATYPASRVYTDQGEQTLALAPVQTLSGDPFKMALEEAREFQRQYFLDNGGPIPAGGQWQCVWRAAAPHRWVAGKAERAARAMQMPPLESASEVTA